MPCTNGVASTRRCRLVWVPLLAWIMPACAPVFSDLQSARLVDKGRVEVTPSASYVGFSSGEEDGSGHVQDGYGVQLGVGLHEAVELRARYEHIAGAGEVPGVEVVGLGPKVRLVRDHLALYVPVGRAFGGGGDPEFSESWQVHPTLLATAPVHRNVEINASAKYLLPLSGDGGDDTLAFNLGLGLGDLDSWVIRPEAGILVNPGEEGRFYHFSLGLSFRPR